MVMAPNVCFTIKLLHGSGAALRRGWHALRHGFPFRSSCGLLSRHFIPSHHLSPHTTETARRRPPSLPSGGSPLSSSVRHIQSGVDISFASMGIGNWNYPSFLSLPPLTRRFSASDPFCGFKGGRSPNCRYRHRMPACSPNRHVPDLVNRSGNRSSHCGSIANSTGS